jgi:hypothetical protein
MNLIHCLTLLLPSMVAAWQIRVFEDEDCKESSRKVSHIYASVMGYSAYI